MGLVQVSGCSKKEPPPTPAKVPGDAAAVEPPDLGPGGRKAFVTPPPAIAPADEPDAGEPFGKVADWSPATIPGTKITFKYPGDVFLMDEDKSGVLLTSSIAVDPVQDDASSAPPQYLFRAKLAVKNVGVVECSKLEKTPSMFPSEKKDSFVEATGFAKKLVVASHAAYMQRLLAHGFNATLVLVELGPKKTLVARIETVGEELRPRVAVSNWHPEAWQNQLAEKVLGTFADPSAPPLPSTRDGGK